MTLRYEGQLDALMNGTLAPDCFSHADHVGVAFEAVKRFGAFEALQVVGQGIRELTTRAGVPNKFHATITMAYVSLIAERAEQQPYDSGEAFLAANADLLEKDFLQSLYPAHRLNSDLARAVPLLPVSLVEAVLEV